MADYITNALLLRYNESSIFAKDEVMVCPNCKKQLARGQSRCPFCGLRLYFESDEDQKNPNNDFYFGDKEPTKKINYALIALIAVLALILVGIAGFWLHGKLTKDNSSGGAAVATVEVTDPSEETDSSKAALTENYEVATETVPETTIDYKENIDRYIYESGLEDEIKTIAGGSDMMTTTVFGERNTIVVEYHITEEVEPAFLQVLKDQMADYFDSMEESARTIIEEIELKEGISGVFIEFRCFDAKGNLMVSKQYS